MKLPLIAMALLLAACGGGDSDKAAAEKLGARLSSGDPAEVSANLTCSMFTTAEIADFSGEPVAAGRDAAGGLGCQWMARDGSGSTIVTVTTPDNHVEASGAAGYRALPDVGSRGFVAGKPGSWAAGAATEAHAVAVSIDSGATSEAKTVDLLRATISKVGGPVAPEVKV